MSDEGYLCGHCSSRRTDLSEAADGRGHLFCIDCRWRMPTERLPDGRLLIHPDPAWEDD